MNKKQETINTYNKGSKELIAKFNSLSARIEDINKAWSFLNKTNPKVIELGCANGRDAKEIIKRTSNYTGIDISYKLLNEAKRVVPDGNFQLADLEAYEFPKEVDIIFAFASLLHSDISHVRKVLEKAEKALNINGVFLISLKYGEYHEETKTEDIGNRTYYFYTPEEIMKIAPTNLKNIYQDIQDLRNQKWFTIILQKC